MRTQKHWQIHTPDCDWVGEGAALYPTAPIHVDVGLMGSPVTVTGLFH